MKLILGKASTMRDVLQIWIFFLVLWPKFPEIVFSYSFCCISNTAERNRRSNVVKQHVRNSRDYHQSAHLHGSFPPKRTTLPRSVSLPAFKGESQTGDGSSQQQHHCLCIKVFPHQPTLCWSERNKKHERSVSIVTTEPATIRQVKHKPHDQNQGTFKVIKLSLFLKQVIENTPEAEHWKLICYNGKKKNKIQG